MLMAVLVMLALSRAEILERMRAPVITQADGLVQVYANCPEDMRREFQMPIARFAAETMKAMYRVSAKKSGRFASPRIIVHVGDTRTNDTSVVAKVSTNDSRVVTRIYIEAPGYADLDRYRVELVKGFYRAVENVEVGDMEARRRFMLSDPRYRIADDRQRLEDWLRGGKMELESGLKLLRKIIEPGVASPRDVLTFASRLYLYPPQYDLRFRGGYDQLSFREALMLGANDPSVRAMARLKAGEVMAYGGGRGELLTKAAEAYTIFLLALADGETDKDLFALLENAETKLNIAFEESGRR